MAVAPALSGRHGHRAPGSGPSGQGTSASASGNLPTRIGSPGRFVAVLMGVTVAEFWLATYAVFPSGVITIARGSLPTLIGLPGRPVAVLIGVTEFPIALTT